MCPGFVLLLYVHIHILLHFCAHANHLLNGRRKRKKQIEDECSTDDCSESILTSTDTRLEMHAFFEPEESTGRAWNGLTCIQCACVEV